MKPTFTIRDLLLAVTFVAITIGGWREVWNWTGIYTMSTTGTVAILSAYWLPFVFLAYVLGRRKLEWQTVGAYLLAEVVAIIYAAWEQGWTPLWG